MDTYANKVIVVTGASEGIGRALCKELAPQKPTLVIAARNEQRLLDLKPELEALGATVLAVATDITQEPACQHLMETTVAAYGRLDVLVNNAGRTMWTRFEDITDTSIFEKIMSVNYLGSVYCTYYALPHLKRSGGQIVAVSSVAGLSGVPARSAYSASKHAMIGFFESIRIELESSGVSVTIVAPDFVLSEIHRRALDGHGKPLGVSPMQESKIMTAEQCAKLMVKAMASRERLLLTSSRAKIARWLKLIAPKLVDRIAAKAIAERK